MKKGESYKPSVKYQAVSLPKPLIDSIKNRIADDDNYRSIAEFVKEAIRGHLHLTEIPEDKEINRLEEILIKIEDKLESYGHKVPSSRFIDISPNTLEAVKEDLKSTMQSRIENLEKRIKEIEKK